MKAIIKNPHKKLIKEKVKQSIKMINYKKNKRNSMQRIKERGPYLLRKKSKVMIRKVFKNNKLKKL
jgi:hypothetical protein